ncbi:acyltransferase family protein [Rheinheimera sp.]|uniref:acyltransferase family protein n=1 Tax=Rheinheimera sp. TaxID=1869214 RepID=UPI003AF699B0
MLGLLRFYFAIIVMVLHLFLGVHAIGIYAVFGFYIMSGYLITRIMHESYSYTWRGISYFIANRCLRLYPVYWIVCLLSIGLIFYIGEDIVRGYHPQIYIPSTTGSYLQNIFMAFIAWYPNEVSPRLVPPTWALAVEIFMYLLIAAGISKSFFRVKIWIFFSICYVGYSFYTGEPWGSRYYPAAAASLPFSVGAAIYFLTKNIQFKQKIKRYRLTAKKCFLMMLLNSLFFSFMYPVGASFAYDVV